MLLSERLISSLENVLQNSGRCFWKELDETCKGHVYPADAWGIYIKGQQSACNYHVTLANGSEESTQTVFTHSQSDAVMSRSSLALIEKIEIPKSTLGPHWVNYSPLFSQMDATPCS